MSKKTKRSSKSTNDEGKADNTLSAKDGSLDPVLSSLFANSSGPVNAPPKSRYKELSSKTQDFEKEISDQDQSSEDDENIGSDDLSSDDSVSSENELESGSEAEEILEDSSNESHSGTHSASGTDDEDLPNDAKSRIPAKVKRKRDEGEEIEEKYMRKLARIETKELEQVLRSKSVKGLSLDNASTQKASSKTKMENSDSSSDDVAEERDEKGSSDSEMGDIPQHISLAKPNDSHEIDKANRTVFLGNVSTQAITSKSAKKTLLKHLSSFIPSLSDHDPPHKIESIRFRSTPYTSSLPKKAAYAKKEIMDATAKSTNAYAVFTTQEAAREAIKRLNGTVILDRHLRVDGIAHPSEIDNRRCVFVGNLGFVDDDSLIREAEDTNSKRKKKAQQGDVEEGLWRQFNKAGQVESVRVIRDQKTRVGKGIAYVQFKDENAVEAALLFNDKKFPPLLPRAIRVTRARGFKRRDLRGSTDTPRNFRSVNGFNSKPTDGSLHSKGRAEKLLGKAQAANMHSARGSGANHMSNTRTIRRPEEFIFEGHRATQGQGKSGLKLNRPGKKKGGIRKNRSTKRAAAWKASGGKGAK